MDEFIVSVNCVKQQPFLVLLQEYLLQRLEVDEKIKMYLEFLEDKLRAHEKYIPVISQEVSKIQESLYSSDVRLMIRALKIENAQICESEGARPFEPLGTRAEVEFVSPALPVSPKLRKCRSKNGKRKRKRTTHAPQPSPTSNSQPKFDYVPLPNRILSPKRKLRRRLTLSEDGNYDTEVYESDNEQNQRLTQSCRLTSSSSSCRAPLIPNMNLLSVQRASIGC
jgi:hypothetical protein